MKNEKSWRQIHLYCTRFKYAKKAEEWGKLERLYDDRLVFCNVYRRMEEALNSLPENPINYVCVAMNNKMEADRQILDDIIEEFDGR